MTMALWRGLGESHPKPVMKHWVHPLEAEVTAVAADRALQTGG